MLTTGDEVLAGMAGAEVEVEVEEKE